MRYRSKKKEAEYVERRKVVVKMLEKFPYCQALRYFYLLQLHGQNHISYAQQLKLSSAYAPDRKRLHQLIHPELMMHDSVAWNENIALENEGMIDTSNEKQEVSSIDIVDIPTDETIGTNQNHPAEISEETPFYSSEIPSPKAIEEETKEVQSEEDAISAEEIVIQRLKELNIWTEPETISPKVEVNFLEEEDEVQSEEGQSRLLSGEKEELLASRASASEVQNEETILVPHGMIEENDDPDLEAEIEELERLAAEKNEVVEKCNYFR